MSSVQASSTSAEGTNRTAGDCRLEVVVIPVADVDRAKDFYTALGWRLDADFAAGDDFRVVQVTPQGSDCSVIFGTGVTNAAPGSSEGMQLVVSDIGATREVLLAKGVEVSEPFHDVGGVFHHGGTDGRAEGTAPNRKSYGSFASFRDPDGNLWFVQEVTTRLPGRVEAHTTYASPSELAEALRRAAAAHGEHEKRIGAEDPDWPVWYAEYMVREQSGEELPQ